MGLTQPLKALHPRDAATALRFLVVGGANTLFAYAIYAAGLFLGAPYQLASIIALVGGIATGFVLQGKVTFRSRLEGRFLPFVALWTLLYLANITLIRCLGLAGVGYYLGGLIAAVPVNAISYLALRYVIFAHRKLDAMRLFLCWCVALVAVARLYIVTSMELNWDEFLNLSMVYSYARGDLFEILQTAFVHLFAWLPLVSANEADQLIAARLVSLACVFATSGAIYGTARRYMDVNASLVSVLAFNCFSYALLYATDFRTDTLATAAMMGAIWLASDPRPSKASAACMGVLVGIGAAMTIKAIFFVPTIAALLLLKAWKSGDYMKWTVTIAIGALAALASLGAILLLHSASFPAHASMATFLGRTTGATLLTGDYSIVIDTIVSSFGRNLGFWLGAGLGLIAAVQVARKDRAQGLEIACFALPLATLCVYRDVYPYCLPLLLAPVAVVVGFGFASQELRSRIVLLLLFAVSAILAFASIRDRPIEPQRQTLAVIHRLFPQPVNYIDHASMVSSFPKKGFFMSTWGVGDYRKAGVPVMAGVIEHDQPKFLLETRSLLAVDRIDPKDSEARSYGLLAADVRSLRNNYQRYWGPLFLPGKLLSGSGEIDIAIAGRYRLKASAPIRFAGKEVLPGTALDLAAGHYSYASAGEASLLWDAPAAPSASPPERLFTGW